MSRSVAETSDVSLRVVIVVKGYPRLSETFVAQEILGLERAGVDVHIVSLRHPTDPARHPVHEQIRAPVTYLPEYLHEEPLRVLRALWKQIRRQEFTGLLGLWFRDLVRDPTRNRLRRMGQAMVLASELPAGTKRIYAHFIHTPGSVARYAAKLVGLPFSLSAHAKDIWTTPEEEIREKLIDADWTVCCTRTNTEHLRQLAPSARVELVYHGLDRRALPQIERTHQRDGRNPVEPCQILCVARAVEKKGLDLLLAALARLPSSLHWQFIHVGGGEKLGELRKQAEQSGVSDRVRWLGALPRADVMEQMAAADIFCLPARIAADGDRDGLPNVLLEALLLELAVATTDVGGISELVEDGSNGLVVEPDNTEMLADALERLIGNPALRQRLGNDGRLRVEQDFAADSGIERVAALLNSRV